MAARWVGPLLCLLPVTVTGFVTPQVQTLAPVARLGAGSSVPVEPRQVDSSSLGTVGTAALLGLCGAAAAAVARGRRIAMQSQGQGGRFSLGQPFMPKLKGAKKMAVLRPRKNYGSYGARQVPRRYPLYDILEELDEKVPWYTVVSEPEEPMLPVEGAPILERYPWAGKLGGVPEAKQKIENDPEKALEPFFGNWIQHPPPLSRRQKYVVRRGWPNYNTPPWINRPLIGEGVPVPGEFAWSKDRRPKPENMNEKQKAKYFAEQAEKEIAKEDKVFGDEEEDDMDDMLDALEGDD